MQNLQQNTVEGGGGEGGEEGGGRKGRTACLSTPVYNDSMADATSSDKAKNLARKDACNDAKTRFHSFKDYAA